MADATPLEAVIAAHRPSDQWYSACTCGEVNPDGSRFAAWHDRHVAAAVLAAVAEDPSLIPEFAESLAIRRRLEDAALALWAELPSAQVADLRAEAPEVVEFLRHLHHEVEHEGAMVRRNVWSPIPGAEEAPT